LGAAARRIVRPVDAAGLVLIRRGRGGPEILLGRRHRRAGFLPDIYVVPGGRVDRGDAAGSGFLENLHPNAVAQLAAGSRGRPPLAFARAAIRETYEETGLLLTAGGGTPTTSAAAGPAWQAYGVHACRPAFDALDFVCRAITPTYSKRRYNTRFFLADGAMTTGELAGNGELEDLGWRPVGELPRLAIVDVTEFVLTEALRRWQQRVPIGREPARLFCYRGDSARWRPLGRGPWKPPPARVFGTA
jgi:8-oxo-dGTP pyrophosphatase MutT (NUDIX family)